MKKIYLSPVMDVIELQQEQMLLAGSAVFDVIDDPTINAEDVDAPIFGDNDLVSFSD